MKVYRVFSSGPMDAHWDVTVVDLTSALRLDGNGKYGHLASDLLLTTRGKSENMWYPHIREAFREVIEEKEGYEEMCDLIQKLIDKKAKEINMAAEKKAKEMNEKQETAISNILRMNMMSKEQVATAFNLPIETVNRLASQL